MKAKRLQLLTATSILSMALAGCGGGGGADDSSAGLQLVRASAADSISVNGGDAIVVPGNARTERNAMDLVTWQLQAVSSGAPTLVLENKDCAVAVRNDVTSKNSGGKDYTQSDWSCSAQIKAPNTDSDKSYQLVLTAKDKAGNSSSHVTALTVKASTAASVPITAAAGPTVSLVAGQSGRLSCLAQGGNVASPGAYAYQWVQTDGVAALLTLSDPKVPTPTFVAPATSAATNAVMQCRATDDAGATAVVTQTVQITASPDPVLIVNAGAASMVAPGATVTLDGSKTGWFSPTGSAVAGRATFFRWTQVAGSTVPVGSSDTAQATVRIPADLVDATSFAFQLDVSDQPFGTPGAILKSATVSVTADPAGSLRLSLPQPSISAKVGASVPMVVTIPSNVSVPVFYSWTQISGPSVAIGASRTSSAGFVAPVVTIPTTFVFRVSAGFKAISGTYPGVSSDDLVVVVSP